MPAKALEHLDTPLNTVGIIRNITCPILLVHARGDRDLESSNSGKLFQVIMGEEKTPEQLKLDFRREEVGPQNYLATYLRREDKLRTKDKRWPIVSYLETEKGVS